MKRQFLAARENEDGELIPIEVPFQDVDEAHIEARGYAKRHPGTRVLLLEAIGFYEAPVLPPRYTVFDQPAPLLLTQGETKPSEDMLS